MTVDGRYRVPAARHSVENTIERSRFICTVERVASREEGDGLVRDVREEFPGATHHCWAFVAGSPGDTGRIGMSDDGEPHGTAGRPMLTVLLHSGIGEIGAVVTRFFGGTKLGTGGLARAYGGVVQLALASLTTTERVDWVAVTIVADYASIAALQVLVPACRGEILAQEYGLDVRYRLRVPAPNVAGLRAAVADATGGRAEMRVAPHLEGG